MIVPTLASGFLALKSLMTSRSCASVICFGPYEVSIASSDSAALVRSSTFWRDRYLPGILANWILWIPAVLMIYRLPAGLQLPVQNLFLVIWVLVAALIARRPA